MMVQLREALQDEEYCTWDDEELQTCLASSLEWWDLSTKSTPAKPGAILHGAIIFAVTAMEINGLRPRWDFYTTLREASQTFFDRAVEEVVSTWQ